MKQSVIVLLLSISIQLYPQEPVHVVRDTMGVDHYERKIFPAPTFTMGVVDAADNIVIPFLYEDIGPLLNGKAIVKKYQKYGIIDSFGNQHVPFVFDEIESFIDNRAVASMYGKWGIIDNAGTETVPFVYDAILHFTGNNAIVKKDDKYGVIAIGQRIASAIQYDAIDAFSEGVAVADKNGKKGVIDTLGQEKSVFMYEWIYPCSGGVLVAVEKGRYSIIDKNGVQPVAFSYSGISSFNKHGIGMISKDGKYGLMNDMGLEIVPLVYDEITLYDDCAAVKNNNRWGVIGFTENIIIPIEYQAIKRFYGDRFLVRKNDRWLFFDTKNKEESPYGFEAVNSQASYRTSLISEYQRIYTVARRDKKMGFVDSLGQIVTPFIFEGERLVPLSDNMLAVQKNGKIALSDFQGKYLSEFDYDEVHFLSDRLTRVQKKGRYGIVNNKGSILIPCEYDGIYPLPKGSYYTLYKHGKFGVADSNGKIVIPLKYASITPFTDKLFVVRR